MLFFIKCCLFSFASVFFLCWLFSISLCVYVCKKQGLHVGKVAKVKKESFFERLFFRLPYQIVYDSFHRPDYSFNESGFHLIVGEQGSGKTITAVYLLKKYKKMYPLLKIRTNLCYTDEDGPIKSWKDLVFQNNGTNGEIDLIDEVSVWFNSLQSKDFPPEMMQEISQQRKQRKMILGTAQVWQRVAKPIREQVYLCYKPITIFGCLTFVRVYKPVVNDDGQAESMKLRKLFFFVHTADLREAFDTYKKIQRISLKGFKSESEQLHSGAPSQWDAPRVAAK